MKKTPGRRCIKCGRVIDDAGYRFCSDRCRRDAKMARETQKKRAKRALEPRKTPVYETDAGRAQFARNMYAASGELLRYLSMKKSQKTAPAGDRCQVCGGVDPVVRHTSTGREALCQICRRRGAT